MARIKEVESILGLTWVIIQTNTKDKVYRDKDYKPLTFLNKIQAMKACKTINIKERLVKASKEFQFNCTVKETKRGHKIVKRLWAYEKTKAAAKKFFLKHVDLQKYLGNSNYSITFAEKATKIQ